MGSKYKNLYNQICTFENIWLASRKARRGKRLKNSVSEFEYNLESNLLEIQKALIEENYEFGEYREFKIYEPKERFICAAPYRDRVVHHAICNIIEPILDKAMIFDSYSCRLNKGTDKAIDRTQEFAEKSKWILKIDIKKYFFTIDHKILMHYIEKKLCDEKLNKLLWKILNTYNSSDEYYFSFEGDTQEDKFRFRGLPIGNLTSQLFANYYLSGLDRFIKEELGFKYYLRYMDDALIFCDDKERLRNTKDSIEKYLIDRRLKIHQDKSQIFPIKNGIKFLGFHIYPYHKRILRDNLRRFKERMRAKSNEYKNGVLEWDRVLLSLNSWLGYADKVENRNIINKILRFIKFQHPGKNYKFSFFVSG
jgi:retron-type reverse transcriptase